jgi:hypothetical protein
LISDGVGSGSVCVSSVGIGSVGAGSVCVSSVEVDSVCPGSLGTGSIGECCVWTGSMCGSSERVGAKSIGTGSIIGEGSIGVLESSVELAIGASTPLCCGVGSTLRGTCSGIGCVVVSSANSGLDSELESNSSLEKSPELVMVSLGVVGTLLKFPTSENLGVVRGDESVSSVMHVNSVEVEDRISGEENRDSEGSEVDGRGEGW